MKRAMHTVSLNEWVCKNASALKQKLSLYTAFDEDAFQDAYLTLATTAETEDDHAGYEVAFIKAYRKFSGKNLSETFSTWHPDELFFSLLPSEDAEPMEDAPEEPSTEKIVAKIQRHIRATFPRRDVRILELRLLGFSYRDITDTFGIGTTAINNTTNRIITQTRREFAAVAL